MAVSVNYDDERFAQVEQDKQSAITDIENTYNGMINESDQYYQSQIDASKEWAEKQQQIQQDNTDFAIEQINQQKDQAQKDYTKEQAGAYVDWQKQSNQYGANAEQMAANGLTNTGFSESSQVGMWNTYQNRVASARQSYNQSVLNYNNAIKEAQLQNNSALAEIAYNALQQQLEISLQGFQYRNQLVLELANQKQQLNSEYYGRWQDVLNQINTENAMAEEIRQYNESMAMQQKQLEEEIRQFNAELERLKAKDKEEYALEIQKLELQKAQLEEEKRQFNTQMAAKKNSSSRSSGKSSRSGSGSAKTAQIASGSSGRPTLVNVRQGALSAEGRAAYNSVKKTNTKTSSSQNTKNVVKLAERKPGETMSEYVMRMKALGMM